VVNDNLPILFKIMILYIKIIEFILYFIATGHIKNIISHTDDEYQYTLIVNTLALIFV
jgi:hypothetical protein